ncbi:MAG TPA: bifunctional UDP-sugar hydrolase/5'-nucleotidase [Thermoanaerobaculia bacterium]|nr:bifunctional UDP-sugar hydrolase/5'-nucleotidase [Thermoanaerobaculia bacterium]
MPRSMPRSKSAPLLAFILLTLLTLSCASSRGRSDSSEVHHLVVVATNDFHGSLAPSVLRTVEREGVSGTEYEVGGAATLAGYINALRSQYGSSLIWLDGGDQFQGPLESNLEEGASVVRFFNAAGLNAAAVGNHEFDYGAVGPGLVGADTKGAFRARMKEAAYPYLASNIEPREKGADPLPEMRRSVMLTAGPIRVGVVGATTVESAETAHPALVKDLLFPDPAEPVIAEAAKLRSEGADVVVLVAHIGGTCTTSTGPSRLIAPGDPDSHCADRDEMDVLLSRLPRGTVDAVVSGHSHHIIHHWMHGVPVAQSGRWGRHITLLHLYYDSRTRRVLPERTRIEGPIPICREYFSKLGNCDGSQPAPAGGRGALVPASIHGRTIVPDERVVALLAPVFARVAAQKARVVATAARPLLHDPPEGETDLGNLVTDSMRQKAGTDFAIVNFFGIRSAIDAGPITFGEVHLALPFDNYITVVRVTGAELKTIMRFAESGFRGYFPLSGLRARLTDRATKVAPTDMNRDGKIEAWEIDRLIELTTSDGQPILDDKFYTLALPDYVAQGGDFMAWPMSLVPIERVQNSTVLLRDAVTEALTRMKTVNSAEEPLFLPGKPRLIFE